MDLPSLHRVQRMLSYLCTLKVRSLITSRLTEEASGSAAKIQKNVDIHTTLELPTPTT